MYTQLRKRRAFLSKGKGSPAIKPGEELADAGGKRMSDAFRGHNAPSGGGVPTGGGPGLDAGNEDDLLSGQRIADHLRAGGASATHTGGGPGISPGDETDENAGDENPFSGTASNHGGGIEAGSQSQSKSSGEGPVKTSSFTGGARHERAAAMAAHHQALADHFRKHAEAAAPKDEAESPVEASGETPFDEELEGEAGGIGHAKPPEGSPEEEAGESPAFEAKEDEEDETARRKKGGGLRNSKANEKPVSRFAMMARGR